MTTTPTSTRAESIVEFTRKHPIIAFAIIVVVVMVMLSVLTRATLLSAWNAGMTTDQVASGGAVVDALEPAGAESEDAAAARAAPPLSGPSADDSWGRGASIGEAANLAAAFFTGLATALLLLTLWGQMRSTREQGDQIRAALDSMTRAADALSANTHVQAIAAELSALTILISKASNQQESEYKSRVASLYTLMQQINRNARPSQAATASPETGKAPESA
jgi:hypothetical protein